MNKFKVGDKVKRVTCECLHQCVGYVDVITSVQGNRIAFGNEKLHVTMQPIIS